LLPDQRFEFPNLTGWKVLAVRVFQLADDEFCEPPSPFRQHGHGLGHRESFVSLSLDRDSKHGTTTVGLVLRALKETFDRTTMDREFAHDADATPRASCAPVVTLARRVLPFPGRVGFVNSVVPICRGIEPEPARPD
jgi:hypothetical protein